MNVETAMDSPMQLSFPLIPSGNHARMGRLRLWCTADPATPGESAGIKSPKRVAKETVDQGVGKRRDQIVTEKSRLSRRLVTTKEAADYLASSPWKVRKLVRDGLLAVVQATEDSSWRFDQRDLDAFIERSKRTGPQ